ncbi:hypothetical protein WS96_10040 [Burkholderia sp. MSMB1835]|nr:hypothetical protein [Burkholderia sp. MSMB1835]KVL37236.1 hypothetical protein WS96_10040 [Burkholderia sp. MSMB1835]
MVWVLLDVCGSCQGQVVDGAIADVLAMLGSIAQWVRASGQLDGTPSGPFRDSPFYDVYICADGGHHHWVFISFSVGGPFCDNCRIFEHAPPL